MLVEVSEVDRLEELLRDRLMEMEEKLQQREVVRIQVSYK